MKVELSEINKSEFIVSERNILGDIPVVFIGPTKGKHEWSEGEVHLRSLLCRPDGEIVCSGFPKFFNFGEMPQLDKITSEGILSGKGIYMEKLDGSLIIRTVIDGEVLLRTRGSHYLGEFEVPVIGLIQNKYPKILDPTFANELTLLFEFVSPGNKVILNYSHPELFFLGAMKIYPDAAPKFFPYKDLDLSIGCPTPKLFELGMDINSIRSSVSAWTGVEGIVVGVQLEDGSYHLSKIKTAEYLKLHALRYHLSDARVEQLCWAGEFSEESGLREVLVRAGLDWELTSFVSPIYNKYSSVRKSRELEAKEFIKQLEKEGLTKLTDKREIAISLKDICEEDSRLFPLGIYYLTGNKAKYEIAYSAYLMDISGKSIGSYLEEGKALLRSLEK